MNYQQAVRVATSELGGGADFEAVAVGLELAFLAWRQLGGGDRRWGGFGLQVLAVRELLPGTADALVVCDPPVPDDPQTVRAVADLVLAVAARLDHAAVDEGRVLVDRLSCDAAAIGLRRAVALLR